MNDEVNNRYRQLDFDDKKSRPVYLIGAHYIGVCCSYDKNVQWKLVIRKVKASKLFGLFNQQ